MIPQSLMVTLLALMLTSCGEADSQCAHLIGGGRYCLQPVTPQSYFEAQQKVEARFNGRQEMLIAEIESDADGVRFVGLTPFGQKLLQVSYNNQAASAALLPDRRLTPALVVALLQLTLWPADAVRAGLAAPLILVEHAAGRSIVNGDDTLFTVAYSGSPAESPVPWQRMHISIPGANLELDIETLPEIPKEP